MKKIILFLIVFVILFIMIDNQLFILITVVGLIFVISIGLLTVRTRKLKTALNIQASKRNGEVVKAVFGTYPVLHIRGWVIRKYS